MKPFYKRATPIIEKLMIQLYGECTTYTSKSIRRKYSKDYMNKGKTPLVCFVGHRSHLCVFLFANKIVYVSGADIDMKLRKLFPGIRFI